MSLRRRSERMPLSALLSAGAIVLAGCAGDLEPSGDPPAIDYVTEFDDLTTVERPPVFDHAGHMLLPAHTTTGLSAIVAVDIETGQEAWRYGTGHSTCVAVTDSGAIVVPSLDDDFRENIVRLDPADGSVVADSTGRDDLSNACGSAVAIGETVVIGATADDLDSAVIYGYDATQDAITFSTPIESSGHTELAVSDDGSVWFGAHDDGGALAVQVDPDDGSVVTTELPVGQLHSYPVGTAAGFAVAFTHGVRDVDSVEDGISEGIVWFDPADGAHTVVLSGTDGFRQMMPLPMPVNDQYVATFIALDMIVVFDRDSGHEVQRIPRPESGGPSIPLGMGIVGNQLVVVPDEDETWLRAYEVIGGALAWAAPSPDERINSARWITSVPKTAQFVATVRTKGDGPSATDLVGDARVAVVLVDAGS